MGRRDFLVAWIQALFLALFPWLRNERGLEVLEKAIEAAVPKTLPVGQALFKSGSFKLEIDIKGYEIPGEIATALMAEIANAHIEPEAFRPGIEVKTS
jgi:hypothetical protein